MLSQDFIRENLFIAPLLQPWVLTSLKKFTYLKSSIKPTNHTQCDQFDKKTKISKTFCVNLRFTHLNCSDWPLNIFQPISVLQISITGSAHVHLFYQVSLIQSLIYNYGYSYTCLGTGQCDQMCRLFVQYLAILNNENQPKRIKYFPKQVHNFAKYYRVTQ